MVGSAARHPRFDDHGRGEETGPIEVMRFSTAFAVTAGVPPTPFLKQPTRVPLQLIQLGKDFGIAHVDDKPVEIRFAFGSVIV